MKNFRYYITIIILSIFFIVIMVESFAQSMSKTTQPNIEGFFTLSKVDDHWWFNTPQGCLTN